MNLPIVTAATFTLGCDTLYNSCKIFLSFKIRSDDASPLFGTCQFGFTKY